MPLIFLPNLSNSFLNYSSVQAQMCMLLRIALIEIAHHRTYMVYNDFDSSRSAINYFLDEKIQNNDINKLIATWFNSLVKFIFRKIECRRRS